MENLKSSRNNKDYLSLSKIAYGYHVNPKWASEKWLSEPTTLEYIQLWESIHNLDFDNLAFLDLCTNALGFGTCPSPEELINKANVKSMFLDKDPDGHIFLHRDLAIDFTSWVSPAFRAYCLLYMQDPNKNVLLNFVSEEDFVISSKSLALATQKQALQVYIKQINAAKDSWNKSQYDYFCR